MFISISTNKESDKKLFYKYLFEDIYLEKRGHVKNSIFNIYPELYSQLKGKSKEKGKKIIENYISNLYRKHSISLNNSVEHIQTIFYNKEKNIEDAFLSTMDEDISNSSIEIIVSMFVKSLFGEKDIILSVVEDILYEKKKPYLGIFLHEMTHIIWKKKVSKIYDKNILSPLAQEDLKEIVAPVILRDSHFDNLLDSQYFKKANQKQQMLFIQAKGKIYTIVDYFDNIYQSKKKEGKNFQEILKIFITIFSIIEEEIITKHNMYNSLALELKDNNTLLEKLEIEGYCSPITYKE